MTHLRSAAISLYFTFIIGCSKQSLMDAAMMSAPRPRAPPQKELVAEGTRYTLLAGDTHCHVAPPDAPFHVSRDAEAALGLARDEHLDFVVFTPHVHARFMLEDDLTSAFTESVRVLDRETAALAKSDVLLIPGFEYTDHAWGHVGFAFGDAQKALAATRRGAEPQAFFEAYVATGGVLTLNHPLAVPLPHAPVYEARTDMSWRAFTRPGAPLPRDVAWLTANAQGIETFNLGMSYLKDRLLRDDPEASYRENHFLIDRQIRAQKRRIVAMGGTDSHGMHLRGVMYVLADARSVAGVRRGMLAGRTCVRGPEACVALFRTDGAWMPVGSALQSGRALEVRAPPGAKVYADGVEVAGDVVPAKDGACAVVRVEVGHSMSGPTYFNCPFARR